MKKLPWWWHRTSYFMHLLYLRIPNSWRGCLDFFAWEQQWADSIGLGINRASKRGRGKERG